MLTEEHGREEALQMTGVGRGRAGEDGSGEELDAGEARSRWARKESAQGRC